MYQFDLAVIGAGPGGYVAAIKAAQLGCKVALVENREVGGTCLNRGCIPTKTLLHSAMAYEEASHFEALGLGVQGLSWDGQAIYQRKEQVVEQLRSGVEQLIKGNKIALYRGTGTLTAPHEVTVNGEVLTAQKVVLATGSVPARPPIPGLDLPGVMTSDELLEQFHPDGKRLLIIGGGVIGVEFASVFAPLGYQVTIVEAMDRLLPVMDREISQNLAMIFRKRGIQVYTGAMVQRIEKGPQGGLCCIFTQQEKETQLEADQILVSIGRRPNTQGLFGPGVSVEMERGRIVTDKEFCTSLPEVYAIGDVASPIQLAHYASAQGICVAQLAAGQRPGVNLEAVPSCIYTNPEIASVGITADEAKQRGIEVTTGKFIMSANGKSLIENQERGFVKLVFDSQSEKLLGAQLMCGRATDLIGELVTAVVSGLTREQLAATMRPHPTFCEGISEAVEDAGEGAVHAMPRRRR